MPYYDLKIVTLGACQSHPTAAPTRRRPPSQVPACRSRREAIG